MESEAKGKKCPHTTATPSVIDLSWPQSLDRKIYVLGGTNLRHLGVGLGLCSPGIIDPPFRVGKPSWVAIRSALLCVCTMDILTSEKSGLQHVKCTNVKFSGQMGTETRRAPIGIAIEDNRGGRKTETFQVMISLISTGTGKRRRFRLSRKSRKRRRYLIHVRFVALPGSLSWRNKTATLQRPTTVSR